MLELYNVLCVVSLVGRDILKLGGETDTCVSEVTCPSHCECIVDGSSVIAAT